VKTATGFLLEQMWPILSCLLALMKVAMLHWFAVVVADSRGRFPLPDSVLAGHTHGGQISLPWPTTGDLSLARMIGPFERGHYRIGDSRLYVNRGLGVAGPRIRLNCTREIAAIELDTAELDTAEQAQKRS
jgi:hypothetical protein